MRDFIQFCGRVFLMLAVLEALDRMFHLRTAPWFVGLPATLFIVCALYSAVEFKGARQTGGGNEYSPTPTKEMGE